MFGIDQRLQNEVKLQAVETILWNSECIPAHWTLCPVARQFVPAVTLKAPETEWVHTAWQLSGTAKIFEAYRTCYDFVYSYLQRRSWRHLLSSSDAEHTINDCIFRRFLFICLFICQAQTQCKDNNSTRRAQTSSKVNVVLRSVTKYSRRSNDVVQRYEPNCGMKRFSHWVHEYNSPPLCSRLCLFLVNRLSHTVHKYGLGLSSCRCSVTSLLSASVFTSTELSLSDSPPPWQ